MRIAPCFECGGIACVVTDGAMRRLVCSKCRTESPQYHHVAKAVDWWNEREVYRGVAR